MVKSETRLDVETLRNDYWLAVKGRLFASFLIPIILRTSDYQVSIIRNSSIYLQSVFGSIY